MEKQKRIIVAVAGLMAIFVLWTILVCCVDVQKIGPQGSAVGLAGINRFVHDLTGVHFALYTITDWLGLIPIGVCAGFGMFGFAQWIKRKKILKVDSDILVLGVFYFVVMAAFVVFELFPVNYRPVLVNGVLEASYPSSTTMLVMCIMLTAYMQINARIKKREFRRLLSGVVLGFIVFMVIGRLVSGVHWVTDIIGGILLSAGLVAMYYFVSGLYKK